MKKQSDWLKTWSIGSLCCVEEFFGAPVLYNSTPDNEMLTHEAREAFKVGFVIIVGTHPENGDPLVMHATQGFAYVMPEFLELMVYAVKPSRNV